MTFRLLVIRICSHLARLNNICADLIPIPVDDRDLSVGTLHLSGLVFSLFSRRSSAKSRTEEETLEGRSLLYTGNSMASRLGLYLFNIDI